jgi:2-oxoglutarate ferredoxin oxidoreductase subunit alpha
MQARWGTHGDHPIIVLSVSTALECFEITVKAFNLAEKYRVPVIVLADEVVAHTRETVALPNPHEMEIVDRTTPSMPPEWYTPYAENSRGVPPMSAFGDGFRHHVTGLVHDVRGFPTQTPYEVDAFIRRLFRKVTQGFPEIQMTRSYLLEDATVAVIAYGSVARSAQRAVIDARNQGIKAGLLQLTTLFPFPRRIVEPVLKQCDLVVVPEMNIGQISREVKRVNRFGTHVEKYNKVDGRLITPDEIRKKLVQ